MWESVLPPNTNFWGRKKKKEKGERERERKKKKKETFGAECTVPVCYVKYASFLWSWVIIILGSYTVFICFKAVSKFCCLRVLLYSIGSWVLRWQVLCTRCRLFQVIAFSKTSNYQIQGNILLHKCLSCRYIIPYILNTLVLHGTFYVQ